MSTPTRSRNQFNKKEISFNPFFKKIVKKLLKVKQSGQGTLTFYFRDGGMKATPFSIELFTDESGKERRFGDIIAILNDLKHDYKAERFDIS